MKQFLLILSVFLTGSIFAQNLQSSNANIALPADNAAMNGANPFVKTTSCGPDTNGYALAKATGLQALNLNNATSAVSVAQYFNAPQAITISGVSFYAWKSDATGGTALNATVAIYNAASDSTPSGAPLITAVVPVDTVFGGGSLDVLRKHATFLTPITVANAYVVVVSNNSANPMSMVFNSWTAAPAPDGGQEWLASARIGTTWIRSYDLNVGGLPFDADGLIEPHTSYTLTASFTANDPCFSTGLTQNFANNSSPVNSHRMYNVPAFLSVPEFSYTWDYGDGSPVQNAINGSHTYAATGAYTVTLTDTLFGWSTNCITDTTFTFGGTPPTPNFSSVETGLTSTFTNTSTATGTPTYSWDFGDGGTSTQANPTHAFPSAGTYTVCLTVTDGCGTNTTCTPITVSCALPTPDFTFATTSSTVAFTNTSTSGSGAFYLWDFGDGNTATTMNASNTYAADGNYTVCLVVSDVCGTDSTCQTVVVSTCVTPTASFVAIESPTGSGSFDFSNTSSTTGTTTYSWDFGDGGTGTNPNPTHAYTSGGTYTVVLTVTDSCGTNVFTDLVSTTVGIDELSLANVTVYPNPSNGLFTIEASSEMKKAFITDLSGKLVYSGVLSGKEAIINAEKFAIGSYFLSIQFENEMTQTIRLEVIK